MEKAFKQLTGRQLPSRLLKDLSKDDEIENNDVDEEDESEEDEDGCAMTSTTISKLTSSEQSFSIEAAERRKFTLVPPSASKQAWEWKYFLCYQENCPYYAVCSTCFDEKNHLPTTTVSEYEVYLGPTRSTSKLRRHLAAHHRSLYNEGLKRKTLASAKQPTIRAHFSASRKERIRDLLLKWMVRSYQPFSECEQEDFRELCQELDPNFQHVCRRTMTEIMTKKAITMRGKAKEMLRGRNLSITTDCWTSGSYT